MRHILSAALALLFCASLRLSAADVTNSIPAPKSYQIRNVKYGDLLRPEDANSANGTRIVLYPAQPWKCMTWRLVPTGDAVFQLRNHFTSKTFAASSTTSTNEIAPPVCQVTFAKDAAARPSWHFVKLIDGAYEIADPKTGSALTASPDDGTAKIVLEPWTERPEQKWELIEIDPATLTM